MHQAHPGSAVTLTGPDLVRIQLQTDEGPSCEDESLIINDAHT